uniref:Agmatinase, mitochondrial-like n=1 Tax=Phallusia mammillata TaxID=59560 RepID=A0A6F9D5G7_9ASCI|nr:agmatinase, mitochondrial-like [Phallusia mammillata]
MKIFSLLYGVKQTGWSLRRCIATTPSSAFNFPKSGNELARSGGIASMMRLPIASSSKGLDACFVGVPLDNGTSNRPGTRFGPRQIRNESPIIRKFNAATHADPFESLMVADIGDVWVNPYNLPDSCQKIKEQFSEIIKDGCIPISAGGDHTITYPILQAIAKKYGPVGLVHVDAHSDFNDTMLGEKIAHGTPFHRCYEEGLLECSKVYQIGLRGSAYSVNDFQKQKELGFNLIPAEECWYKSMTPLMEKIRAVMGNTPVYLSFDIDGLDPAYAPGTGTPEIGGLTSIQGLEVVRGCKGLNLVGADLVEVSPTYDTTGTTALTGANLMFEMLCVLPGVKYHQ